jgi:hypothetical protein
LLACAFWLCAPARLRASEAAGRRVVLVGAIGDRFLERVGDELEALGFSLVHSDDKGPLDVVTRDQHAEAALRVLPARNGVEIWMADSTSGRSLLRHVVVDEDPRGPDRELIALQTAELLRTSLLGEKSPPKRVDPPKQTPEPAVDTRSRTSERKDSAAQLACGALYSPGGARAALQLGASLRHFLRPRWGVGLDLSVPLRSGELTGVEGAAKVGSYFAGALALVRVEPTESLFFATVGAGAAFLLVKYEGSARAPLRSSSGTQPAGALYVRGDLGFQVASWLRLGVRALAGASFQRTQIKFAGNAAGSYGPALLAGFFLAEVALL